MKYIWGEIISAPNNITRNWVFSGRCQMEVSINKSSLGQVINHFDFECNNLWKENATSG